MNRHAVFTGLAAALVAGGHGAPDRPDPQEISRVVAEIERLDTLRSTLAERFEGRDIQADRTTFQQVCKPVRVQAQRLASENGWTVRQQARKYRNPNHALDAEADSIYELFSRHDALMGIWTRTSAGGKSGSRYYRRIVVESACLACHGAKDARPDFVKQTYPQDRAYGFDVGDLRGLYSVFLPDEG